MKKFLLGAIVCREDLLKNNKGYVDKVWALNFMKHLKFWIHNGADCNALSQRWDNEIRIILTPSWVKKYEQLKYNKDGKSC